MKERGKDFDKMQEAVEFLLTDSPLPELELEMAELGRGLAGSNSAAGPSEPKRTVVGTNRDIGSSAPSFRCLTWLFRTEFNSTYSNFQQECSRKS